MLREKKTKIIDQLASDLSRSNIIIATSYQGLPAEQMAELRRALADAAVDYHVIKNTLARLAAKKAGKEKVVSIIEGPTALAFGYDDIVTPAKTLSQYIRSVGLTVQIKGALLGEQVLSAGEVADLASLPPKEVLIVQLIIQLKACMTNLHNILNSPLQGLLNVLQAEIQKAK